MELTQAAVDDLLAQLGPGGGHVYVPGGVGARGLVEVLEGRYGAARTLVLEGFRDPTVDGSRGGRRCLGRWGSGP